MIFIMKIACIGATRTWVRLALAVAFGLVVSAGVQSAGTAASPRGAAQDPPVFRTGVTLVTTDVIVRDGDGLFLPDLTTEDFIVYEDGQPQEVASLVLVHGGRVYNQLLPAAAAPEGIVLPSSRPATNTPGRIFVLFIDDLHLSVTDTPKVHSVLELIEDTLIHEGDLFGIISSGRSSIQVQMTYDRDEISTAIDKVVGEALSPRDLVDVAIANSSRQEARWRANVAFKVARQTVHNLAEVQNRRKVFLYVSGGYDFNPFDDARAAAEVQRMADIGLFDEGALSPPDLNDPNTRYNLDSGNAFDSTFSDTDLQQELLLLTSEANRANVSFYTIDPRGLGPGADLDFDLGTRDWNEYVRTQHTSLRALADLTGGMAVVNRNTFDEAFKEIDAETSDYYVLGFYSSNPDPTHQVRELRVEVNQPDVDVRARTHYVLANQTVTP